MPKMTIDIEMGNSAFYDGEGNFDPNFEIARILNGIVANIQGTFVDPEYGAMFVLHDVNGNKVGNLDINPD